jgi:hypothetical protein
VFSVLFVLHRNAKRYASYGKAMLDLVTWQMKYAVSRKYFVLLFHVRIVVLQSHACQAATTCVVGTVISRSAMVVASH